MMNSTPDLIRQARKMAGLSQTQLGCLLDPPRTHAAISDIERGKTRLSPALIQMIARALSIDPEILIDGDDDIVYRGYRQAPSSETDQAIRRFQQFARIHVISR